MFKNSSNPFWGRKLVGNVLQQHGYAEWLRKGFQVLDACHRGIEFLLVEVFPAHANVLNEILERNLLSDLDGALDLVHGLDARTLFDFRDIERWAAALSPLVIHGQGRVHRI